MRKLKTTVHAVERDEKGNTLNSGVFGPNDDLPGWAEEAITNPDVWVEDEGPAAAPGAETSEEFPADSDPEAVADLAARTSTADTATGAAAGAEPGEEGSDVPTSPTAGEAAEGTAAQRRSSRRARGTE